MLWRWVYKLARINSNRERSQLSKIYDFIIAVY